MSVRYNSGLHGRRPSLHCPSPAPGLAARIAAVPYDVVNAEEARALADDPLSFLHVSRAEIDLPPATDPYADAVYARAVANFDTLKRDGARGRGRGRRSISTA